MGVNCNVTLNNGADWKKVGQVACVLLGATKRREPLGSNGWHIMVDGFDYGKFESTSMPEYIHILVSGDPENPLSKAISASDSLPYMLWYGLERRSLYPKATAAKIALAEGITKFFGGSIIHNDAIGKKRNFPTVSDFSKETDGSFYRFQNALEALEPLTQADIDRCQKYAAY